MRIAGIFRGSSRGGRCIRRWGRRRPPWLLHNTPQGLRTVYQPHHVDGRSLVILRRQGNRLSVAASGELHHDGEILELENEGQRRIISDAELASFMAVRDDTLLVMCKGFD